MFARPYAVPRFDDQALSAPHRQADEARWCFEEGHTLDRLAQWCRDGGSAPAQGLWAEADADRRQRVAQALARTLDGSRRLEALPRWAGWAWRVQVLMADRREHLAADHPWDAGWATPGASERLASHFVPRRPTLVLVDAQVPDEALHRLLHARDGLFQRLTAAAAPGAPFVRPLRWLWLAHPAQVPPALAALAALPRLAVDPT